jgi:hypothetical protein
MPALLIHFLFSKVQRGASHLQPITRTGLNMQVRDLIAELQRYDQATVVKIAVERGDDTNHEDIAEVNRESGTIGQYIVLEPYNT